jgi:hypothetical protein
MTHIYVIHENAAWLEPLARALDAEELAWRDWFLDQGAFDLSQPPPQGVFYNRMSASSHTRGHRYAAELTAAVLAWLAGNGRRIVNGPRALDLEISKARQYSALEAAGIRTPRTILVSGKDQLLERFPIRSRRKERGFQALADWRSCGWTMPLEAICRPRTRRI